MKEESKQFIINLANEMQKQDTRCTAQPYGLVIRNTHKIYGIHLYRNPEMEQLFEVIFELAKELKGEGYE